MREVMFEAFQLSCAAHVPSHAGEKGLQKTGLTMELYKVKRLVGRRERWKGSGANIYIYIYHIYRVAETNRMPS